MVINELVNHRDTDGMVRHPYVCCFAGKFSLQLAATHPNLRRVTSRELGDGLRMALVFGRNFRDCQGLESEVLDEGDAVIPSNVELLPNGHVALIVRRTGYLQISLAVPLLLYPLLLFGESLDQQTS